MVGAISRRKFLHLIGAGTAAMVMPLLTWKNGSGASKPNVILIMVDDMGYECLSCYGSTSYQTPELDALARNGLRFEHCYSQPLCTPSRVKIMTGQYNFRNYTEFGALHPDEKTFGHMMQQGGYATCIAGKWQLAARNEGIGTYPKQAGFDEYCLWQIDERQGRYADPFLYENSLEPEMYEGEYGPAIFTEFINAFMEQHRDEPFFVYYPMVLMHSPFVPTPDSEEWQGNRDQHNPKFFADMIAYMDKIVGQIVRKTEELGISENTLLLFTSDNGTHRNISSKLGECVIYGQKGHPTDWGTRVPLIAYWPGVTPQGKVLDDLIDFSDFMPTIAEVTGASLPKGEPVDGVSFAPQIRGERGNPRDYMYCYYEPKWANWETSEFARDQRWKLYRSGELYDIPRDPMERLPISKQEQSPEAAAARERLQKILDSIR